MYEPHFIIGDQHFYFDTMRLYNPSIDMWFKIRYYPITREIYWAYDTSSYNAYFFQTSQGRIIGEQYEKWCLEKEVLA